MFKIKAVLNIIFCLFVLLSHIDRCYAAPIAHQIEYTLSPSVPEKPHCLTIAATLKGKASGKYLIRIPQGAEDLQFRAKGFHSAKQMHDPFLFNLIYEPNTDLHFTYQMCFDNPNRMIDFPVIETNYLFAPIHALLILPEEDVEQPAVIKMDLDALPKNYKIASSFNVNQRKYEIHDSVFNFLTSIISAGQIKIDEFLVNKQKVHLVSNGKWDYLEKDPIYYCEKALKAHRAFWQDNDFKSYVIFLNKQKEPYLHHFSQGNHWKDSLVVQMPEGKEVYAKFISTMSHELTHAWTGRKLWFESEKRDLQWFVEGFTDYYGLTIALRSGLIKRSDYLDIYNTFIKEYYVLPVKMSSNAEIGQYFKIKGDYGQLAQLRGHFVANMLQPNLVEHKQYPLDEAMRALLKKFQASGQKYVTIEMIDEVFNQYIGKSTWAKAKRMMTSGELLQFDPHLFAPVATLTMVEFDVPALGFDGKTLIRDSMVQNIDKKSNAFKAGLRNGQKVVNYQINFKRPEEKVVIYIKEQDKVREISFLPNVKKMKIPQYVLNT